MQHAAGYQHQGGWSFDIRGRFEDTIFIGQVIHERDLVGARRQRAARAHINRRIAARSCQMVRQGTADPTTGAKDHRAAQRTMPCKAGRIRKSLDKAVLGTRGSRDGGPVRRASATGVWRATWQQRLLLRRA
jgi:hypothetical protein